VPLGWLDTSEVPFHAVALLERFQLRMLAATEHEESLAIALRHNPVVAYCVRARCPEIAGRLDEILARVGDVDAPEEVRRHEVAILDSIQDWLVYALDPAAYDTLPFLGWDSQELSGLTDFAGKTVLDVGAGTGRLTFAVAPVADRVYASEPVANLRDYLRSKAADLGRGNVFVVDGLITELPFPDQSFDVTMGGHVFGDEPAAEHAEMVRVTRPGGVVIHCPGNRDADDERHRFLMEQGFSWARFEEPGNGWVRKYWRTR
jgi:SAM-dependent methyltransferase